MLFFLCSPHYVRCMSFTVLKALKYRMKKISFGNMHSHLCISLLFWNFVPLTVDKRYDNRLRRGRKIRSILNFKSCMVVTVERAVCDSALLWCEKVQVFGNPRFLILIAGGPLKVLFFLGKSHHKVS